MNRALVIIVALSVMFAIGPLADEIPSGSGPGNSKTRGLILTFDDWPPDGADMDPLLRRLHSAGLKPVPKFPPFRVWLFEWDEWQEGPRAENLCMELLQEDRTSSLLENCEPDYLLHPARRRRAYPSLRNSSGMAGRLRNGIAGRGEAQAARRPGISSAKSARRNADRRWQAG